MSYFFHVLTGLSPFAYIFLGAGLFFLGVGLVHLLRKQWFGGVVGVFLGLGILVIFGPNFLRERGGGVVTACKSNLKNLAAAMEMYSTDWSGEYPADPLRQLTPNYLKTLPECPEYPKMTYEFQTGQSAPYNTQSYEDYYIVSCKGDNHTLVSVPVNYPQYNGIVGLIER